MSENQYSDLEKLQLLLPHWLQHNESHGAEYVKWAEAARKAGHSNTADLIEQAVDYLEKADRALTRALESVGGPGEDHHHHHD